ncbi:response regulator transcription factor [Brooklawnia cerclae]|uniref:DNA-binding NarL/FixJ family response regulator n=1 Tax=Brooklawnia cerclae TaxID=349934 RepID=A0ABX0SDL7_9ACTN|nr:response regulator transcription factor [Brooklawnia cerclae]NIH56488.1 DNA-binding NarL/FixJ family response regulator [Brooklawnia cerclae]
MPERAKRALVVDDDPIVRDAVARMLARRGAVEIVDTLGDGFEVIAYCDGNKVDAVLMDARMPGLDGLSASADLKTRHPELRVVLFSSYDSGTTQNQARASMADAFVSKSASIDEIEAALLGTGERSVLTGRECEVVVLAAEGLTSQQIGRRLGIGESTVKAHIASGLRKSGAKSRTQLVRWAIENGYIT